MTLAETSYAPRHAAACRRPEARRPVPAGRADRGDARRRPGLPGHRTVSRRARRRLGLSRLLPEAARYVSCSTATGPDGAARDRFTAEANAARRVAPFCAARILGAGFDGGHAFLVSEYVAGPSLREFVTERRAVGGRGPRGAGHRDRDRAGRHPPGRAGARRLRPRARGARRGGPAGGRVRDHPALRLRHPRRRHAGLGPHHAVRGGGRARGPEDPEDLDLLPEPLRALAVRCIVGGPRRPAVRPVRGARAARRRRPARGSARRRERGARRGPRCGRRPRPDPGTGAARAGTRRASGGLVGQPGSRSASWRSWWSSCSRRTRAASPARRGRRRPRRTGRRRRHRAPAARRCRAGGRRSRPPWPGPGRARSASPARPARRRVQASR